MHLQLNLKKGNDSFSLNGYKRYVPESKRKLSTDQQQKIIEYLNTFSKETCLKNEQIRHLEYSKKVINNKYISDSNNRKITYKTFIKYCPKNYKIGKRK